MNSAGRWNIVEYGQPLPVLKEMAASSGLSLNDIKQLVRSTGERIAFNLGMTALPLTVERDSIMAMRVAGLVRIAPGIELEIAPKFLGREEAENGWREDFFFLAMLSKHGKVLSSERLRSGRSDARELPLLVARTMIQMQRANSRRPLRTYRRSSETSFDLDGDVDAESTVIPNADGFFQEYVRFDRRNEYNATIKAALRILQAEVRDPEICAQLGRALTELGDQASARAPRYRRLPSRSRRWQEQHDLAVDVQKGIGISFNPDSSPRSPGFVVSTWQVWEDLLTLAVRIGFPHSKIHAQQPLEWGSRERIVGGEYSEKRTLPVKPDIRLTSVIELDGRETLLLDAKYRTKVWLKQQRIDEADVYESLAFARAASVDTVILLYPAVPTDLPVKLGSVTPFERVIVEGVQIYGLQVEVRGVSALNGLRTFSSNLRGGIVSLLRSCHSNRAVSKVNAKRIT
jgi:5-methylcytosine-specific restriction enzyme subunit McrC